MILMINENTYAREIFAFCFSYDGEQAEKDDDIPSQAMCDSLTLLLASLDELSSHLSQEKHGIAELTLRATGVIF